jgi:hypothetical protein
MILACYECRSYLEEEERLPDRKLEEYRPKKNAGPRHYGASYNFKRGRSKFGEDFHQYDPTRDGNGQNAQRDPRSLPENDRRAGRWNRRVSR